MIVEEPSSEPKESNPANLVHLKTQASALRDQIYTIEKEEEMKGEAKSAGNNRRFSNMNSTTGSVGGDSLVSGAQSLYHSSKASRKQRDKLAIIEADIVLAAPQLLFQVGPCNIMISIFLSLFALIEKKSNTMLMLIYK